MRRIIFPLISCVFTLFVFSQTAFANGRNDYTDVFIYNANADIRADEITFDLSREIPVGEKFSAKLAIFKDSKRVALNEMTMDGGKSVRIFNVRNIFSLYDYGTYAAFVKICPADSPFSGSGEESGCGPAGKIPIRFYPWKLDSGRSDEGRALFVSLGEKIDFSARFGDIYKGKPELIVSSPSGRPSDVLSCVEKQDGTDLSWQCTVKEGGETSAIVSLGIFGKRVSNNLSLFISSPERLHAIRFAALCGIKFVSQNESDYKYEIVRSSSLLKDKVCSNAFVSVAENGRIAFKDSNSFVVRALPSAPFTIFAQKGDGPRIVRNENFFDPELSNSLECQTLVKQDEGAFFILKRDSRGREVSSCNFNGTEIVPLAGTPSVMFRSGNQIAIDATYPSRFELKTSVSSGAEDSLQKLENELDIEVNELSEEEKAYIDRIYPGTAETFEIVPNPHAYDTEPRDGFSDVYADYHYGFAVLYLAQKGVIEGYSDGTFRPNNLINRAEFVKMIVNAVFKEERISECKAKYFSDAVNDAWFDKYICTAKEESLISGYPDGAIRPSRDINFAEAAKIIVNAFGLPSETAKSEPWYAPYISILALRNAIPLSISGPSEKLKRGEMAEIIFRIMEDRRDFESKEVESFGF